MAGRGAAPKGQRSRERDNPTITTLVDDGTLYGDPLPVDALGEEEDWHPRTLAWWEALRANPIMVHETAMGWEFMLDTALLHHKMWAHGRVDYAAEVRLRVAKFGATPEDRQRLKIRIEAPSSDDDASTAGAGTGTVTHLDTRRERLLG